MTERVTEESAAIPAEVILIIIIFLILIFALLGGSIEGIFSIFKGLFAFIFVYLLGSLRAFLGGG